MSLQIRLTHSLVCQNDLFNENRKMYAALEQSKKDFGLMQEQMLDLNCQLGEYWRLLQRKYQMVDSELIYNQQERESNTANHTIPPLLGLIDDLGNYCSASNSSRRTSAGSAEAANALFDFSVGKN